MNYYDINKIDYLFQEKEYIIKSCLKKLNIYYNHDEYFHIGKIGLWKAIEKYDCTKDNNGFDYYAYKYVMGYIKNQIRFNSKYILSDKIELIIDKIEQYPNRENGYINNDELIFLMNKYLSDKVKNVILSRYYHGYSVSECANIYNCSENDIRNWCSRGIKKLNRYYNEYNKSRDNLDSKYIC